MIHAIRTEVIVQSGGRIEIAASELSPGTRAEVIVLEQPTPRKKKRPLISFFGKGKGCFSSAEEVDAFLRRERDSWP